MAVVPQNAVRAHGHDEYMARRAQPGRAQRAQSSRWQSPVWLVWVLIVLLGALLLFTFLDYVIKSGTAPAPVVLAPAPTPAAVAPTPAPQQPAASAAPAPQAAVPAPTQSATGNCTVPGTVWIPQVGGCVKHVTNIAEIQKVVPDTDNDPQCRGKPPGHTYDKSVVGPDGASGVAHIVCGRRPS